MKKILQAMDGISTKPVEGSNDMKNFLQVVTEGANPHKVALPVQMAMQHYQQPKVEKKKFKESIIEKYFHKAEEQIQQRKEEKQQLIKQYAQVIAERVRLKESATVNETPIGMTGDPNDPIVHSHQKANPMSLKGRIMQARAQLKELAELAERDDLLAWEEICKKAKGGMFMGLEQNLEQIRHGIEQLAAKRKQGGIASRGIDKNIGEGLKDPKDNPCWKGYKPVGTKKKGGRTVPNCVPKK
jgi:hypothetical protein